MTLTAWVKRNGTEPFRLVVSKAGNSAAGMFLARPPYAGVPQSVLSYDWNDDWYTWGDSGGGGLMTRVPVLFRSSGAWALAALVVEPWQATLYLGTPGDS